jgi:hypothetical protein
MKWFVTALVAFVGFGLPAYSQQKAATKTALKPAPAKQTAAKPVPAKQVQTKQVPAKQAAATQVQAKLLPSKGVSPKPPVHYAAAARRPTPRYYYQTQPTPDRYKEIQQALAERGYFNGSADGTWGPSSSDALKRFQHDQNLTEEGKIDALSLTALGLGPRRTAPASVIPPQAP